MDHAAGDGDAGATSTKHTYQRLARHLAQRIMSRELAPGSRLPNESDFARQLGVSRGTLRGALEILDRNGLIRRIPGKGTFVSQAWGDDRWFSTASTILLMQIRGHMPSMDTPGTYYGDIHAGIRQMAHAMGLKVRTEHVRGYVRVPLEEYRPPMPAEISGVILAGTFDEQYIRMYQSAGVPMVVIDLWPQDLTTDSVAVDVEAEARVAVDYLADRGHTTLGFMAVGRREAGSNMRGYDPDIPRMLSALRQAAQRRQMEIRDEWIVLPSGRGQLEQMAGELVSLRSRPTAVICFSENIARCLFQAMDEEHIRCPEDISVVCRGTTEVAGRTVTAFVGDPQMMGRQAVRLLVERLQGHRQQAARLALASRLVLGTTTAPAPRPKAPSAGESHT